MDIGRAALRIARDLGLLLRDVLALLWRVLLDIIWGAQLLWRLRQSRQHPERAAAFEAWRSSLRDRRAARWAPWRALPLARRAVAIASIALVTIGVSSLGTRSPLDSPSSAIDQATPIPAPADTSRPVPTGASPSIATAAARMKSAMASAPAHGWVFLPEGPVLAPGPPAAFDGFYVSNPAIVRGDDRHYQAWYRGCRLHGRTHDCAIGHAVSPDGLVWNTDGRPALVPLEGADEFHLGGIAVARVDGTYYLWYSVEASMFSNRPSSPLFLATSQDGSQWTQHGRVLAATEQVPRSRAWRRSSRPMVRFFVI
jgi:hypothetical protein